MDLEKNYKLIKRITMLLTMAVLFVMSYMIVYADDVESIELGKSYSGIISNTEKREIEYYYSDWNYEDYLEKVNAGDEYTYRPSTSSNYDLYKLNVNKAGFYSLNTNLEMYENYELIFIDEKGIEAPYWQQISNASYDKNGELIENTLNENKYVFLDENKDYTVIVDINTDEKYQFSIEYYGQEIESTSSWYENNIKMTEKQKVTSKGEYIISGSGSVYIEKGSLLNGSSASLTCFIKTIKLEGAINMLWLGEPISWEFPYIENIEFGSNLKYISEKLFDDLERLKLLKFHCEPPKVISNYDASVKLGYMDNEIEEWYSPEDKKTTGKIFNNMGYVEAHYPAGCKAWSSDVCKNYGGNIKWVADSNLFTDVSPDYWFYDGVQYVNQNKLMTGVGNGAFGPNKATSRAMLATILYRMDGEKKVDEKAAFSDVSSSQYYADAVAWAIKNGIMVGRNNEKFAPNDKATRQELTSAMYQYAKYLGKDVSKQANLSKYKDASMLSSYGEGAREAFAWAVENGIVSGTSDTQLSPSGNASRAQFAVILKRFAENIK